MACMLNDELQSLCERGQRELMRMNYLEAERILAAAEEAAWGQRDWDTLARLYMPLQEARRQRRQHCGEGVVRLDLIARTPSQVHNPKRLIQDYPFGQLLIAGYGSIRPAVEFRHLAQQIGIYVETFLGASFATDDRGLAVAIFPFADMTTPSPEPQAFESLRQSLPRDAFLVSEADLPKGTHRGTVKTYALVMALWERLHTPLLAAGDAEQDPVRKIEAYRRTIVADYACELAHQKLADAARELARSRKSLE